jgi:hypothetical protein
MDRHEINTPCELRHTAWVEVSTFRGRQGHIGSGCRAN